MFPAYVPTAHTYVHTCKNAFSKKTTGKKTKRTFPAFSAPGLSISATSDVSWPRRGRDKRKDVGRGKRKHAHEGHIWPCMFFSPYIYIYIHLLVFDPVIYLLGGLRPNTHTHSLDGFISIVHRRCSRKLVQTIHYCMWSKSA